MGKFQLFYLDYLIADFVIDEDNYISYIPYEETVRRCENDIFSYLKIKTNCPLNDIPFINNRINYILKFNLNELKYETDNYTIKRIL